MVESLNALGKAIGRSYNQTPAAQAETSNQNEFMKRNITLGAMAEPLSEQLAGIIHPNFVEQFDKDASAISRLYIRGMITDAESNKARKRLMKKILFTVSNLPHPDLKS